MGEVTLFEAHLYVDLFLFKLKNLCSWRYKAKKKSVVINKLKQGIRKEKSRDHYPEILTHIPTY